MPDLDVTQVWNFATALLIGALIGIEREHFGQQHDLPGIAGLRTFILYALFGSVAGWLSLTFQSPWVLAAGLLAVAGALLAGYVLAARQAPENVGQTTEIAALATYLLGAVAAHGERELAVGLGVTIAAVLAYKQPLHGFVEKLGSDDVYAGVRLLIATFIVLPLLPDKPLDPWQALNPQMLWLLVLLISTLSMVGYVLTRLLGAHHGLPLTGLTGGLVSSTAVTLAFARQSREPAYRRATQALECGLLLASVVSFLRVLVEVLIVNRAVLLPLLPPIGAMTLVCGAFAAWHLRRAGRDGVEARALTLRNPFSLTSAIKFAAVFALVLLAVQVVQARSPEGGLYVVALLAGTTNVDAMTLSMANYARTGNMDVAVRSITLAVLSNLVVKAGLVVALGDRSLWRPTLVATAATVAAGIGGLALA